VVSHKKISYDDAVRKPAFSGANSIPILNRKQWKPRILVFDRLGHHNVKNVSGSNKISVFDRLDFCHNKTLHQGMSNPLVPKSNVFDRLRFDLSGSEKAKNSDSVMQSTNGNGAAIMGHPTQNSNMANSQGKSYSYRYCVRCLKRGHLHTQCHGSVVCHKCHIISLRPAMAQSRRWALLQSFQ
jgi:hypothetical protein